MKPSNISALAYDCMKAFGTPKILNDMNIYELIVFHEFNDIDIDEDPFGVIWGYTFDGKKIIFPWHAEYLNRKNEGAKGTKS